MSKSNADKKWSRLTWSSIVLCILTLLGLYLRVRHLGALGFWGDEDLTSLAVKAILKHGYPLLPSEMIYPRSVVLHYIMAASAKWLGPTEFALRLPVALIGTALIPMAFLMSSRLYGKVIGMLVAGMLCLSFREIEIARYARMYAPFAFFYVLTVYGFYHYYVAGRRGPRWVILVLAVFTLSLHKLAFSLAFMFLIPFLFRNYKVVPKLRLILNFLTVAGAFLILDRLQGTLFHRPRLLHPIATAGSDIATQVGNGLVGRVLGGVKDVLSRFQTPSFDALDHLVRAHAALSAWLLVATAVLIVAMLWWSRRHLSRGQQVLLGLILASCGLQQFNVAFPLFMIFAYTHRKGLLAFRKPSVLATAGFIAVSFTLWFLYAYFALEPSEQAIAWGSTHTRQALKTLLNYPSFRLVWGYVLARPLLSIPAAFGFLACFHAAASEKGDQKALFLMLMFAGPLFLNGLMESHYELFRYSVHVDVFYLTLAALGAVAAPLVLNQICLGRAPHITLSDEAAPEFPKTCGVAALLALSLIAFWDLNPVKTWTTTGLDCYAKQGTHGHFLPDCYPDFKGAARYVRSRMRPDDMLIAVLTTREYYNYLGRLDYWVGMGTPDLRTYPDGEILKDLYVAVPQIRTVDELKAILQKNDSKRKWLLASSRSLRSNNPSLTPQIVDYIVALQNKVVYVAKDQNQQVYVIE